MMAPLRARSSMVSKRGKFFFQEGDARVLAFLLAHRLVEQTPE
jgi:hypothetical protein